jgi:AcrR family transcriptional regulator
MAASRPGPPGGTKERILAASLELMNLRGYHGTSLRDIAEAAEVQIASIYYHFESKQTLLMRIMEQTLRDLTEAVLASVREEDLAPEQLRAAILAHLRFHAERPAEAFIVDSEIRALETENRQVSVELRDRYEAIFSDILERGVRDGAFKVHDVRLATFALMATCTSVAGWFRPGGRLTIDDVAGSWTALFLEGIASGGAGGRPAKGKR